MTKEKFEEEILFLQDLKDNGKEEDIMPYYLELLKEKSDDKYTKFLINAYALVVYDK